MEVVFVCLLYKIGFKEPSGDAFTILNKVSFSKVFGIQHKNYDLCLQLKLLSTQLGLELNIELDLTHNAAPKVD